jgi:hypothetical protein
MTVEVFPARYRNHIRQNVRFVCRADADKFQKEIDEERKAQREAIQQECEVLRRDIIRSMRRLKRDS